MLSYFYSFPPHKGLDHKIQHRSPKHQSTHIFFHKNDTLVGNTEWAVPCSSFYSQQLCHLLQQKIGFNWWLDEVWTSSDKICCISMLGIQKNDWWWVSSSVLLTRPDQSFTASQCTTWHYTQYDIFVGIWITVIMFFPTVWKLVIIDMRYNLSLNHGDYSCPTFCHATEDNILAIKILTLCISSITVFCQFSWLKSVCDIMEVCHDDLLFIAKEVMC